VHPGENDWCPRAGVAGPNWASAGLRSTETAPAPCMGPGAPRAAVPGEVTSTAAAGASPGEPAVAAAPGTAITMMTTTSIPTMVATARLPSRLMICSLSTDESDDLTVGGARYACF
jgi:hypothetical protein